MSQTVIEQGSDRIIIRLDPGGPIELTDLTESFAALARMYERHYRRDGADGPAPKLYVTRLESGSVIAEIVPYAFLLGAIIYTMDSGIIVSDFTRRLCNGIKAFSDPNAHRPPDAPAPSKQDAEDIRAFVRPLTGKPGANLGVKHARLETHDGDRHTLVEYIFDETEINRAAVNIDEALAEDDLPLQALEPPELDDGSIVSEVMLFFDQASAKPGKQKGRTGDRGIVPTVSDKALPVYFRKSFQNLKDQMVKGEVNPLTNAFVVDVHVQRIDGEPKGYIVTDVHEVFPRDDAD